MKTVAPLLLSLVTTLGEAPAVSSQTFDPNPAWPLCGRITEAPPMGWSEGQGCPSDRWGDAAFNDFPASDTFGPRDNHDVYDFHRGIDLPTGLGTPVFAVAAGTVDKAEPNGLDGTVQIEHLRPGASDCATGNGCFYSRYIHVRDVLVFVGQSVTKGQLIARTGQPASEFEHLHFEVRNAPAFDPKSSWQRTCVHPLRMLPYPDAGATKLEVLVTAVDQTDPMSPDVDVQVKLIDITELDLNRVEVSLFEELPDGSKTPIVQSTATPDANGYFVNPPWVDLEQRNFSYSHQDSSFFPWESFDTCPYSGDHPLSYDANVHVDQNDPMDVVVGDFNGNRIRPLFSGSSAMDYVIEMTFQELERPSPTGQLCVEATATDINANETTGRWNCASIFADGFESGDVLRWSASAP